MRAKLLACIAFGIAIPSGAQTIPPKEAALLDAKLGKVTARGRTYFYKNIDTAGCPAVTPACRTTAYVVTGDVVLLGRVRGGAIEAQFGNGVRETRGWLPLSAVALIPITVPSLSDWRGNWVRDDEANIDITSGGRPGTLSFAGTALWNSHDPEARERGSVHVGQIDTKGTPRAGRVSLVDFDGDCKIRARRIGPYLVIADNYFCGGASVTFSGIYKRRR
ncbi:MAG: hypothetical protein ACTHJR_12135 [Sphingomonas sp.]|uniref:hypothetical protein n=1 Tax=Sphingomonas sp. TaxID=28214 RepID=UPI003F81888D